MTRYERIKKSAVFEAFSGFVNRFCDEQLIGIPASAKTLYHSMTFGDLLGLFGEKAGVAHDLLLAFNKMADDYGIPCVGLFFNNKQKNKSQEGENK